MALFTVILRHPDYVQQDDNGWAGTSLSHVEANSPEDAFGEAQDAMVKEYSTYGSEPTDWAVVAIFDGHLQCLHIP